MKQKHSAFTLAEVLNVSDEEKMNEWIIGLSEKDYKEYHNYCFRHIDGIKEYKLFKSNNNNIYSYEEITGEENVLYSTDTENIVYNDIEYIDLDNLTTSDNYQLFQYIRS